jgi:hypothetical protein
MVVLMLVVVAMIRIAGKANGRRFGWIQSFFLRLGEDNGGRGIGWSAAHDL